MDRPPSNSGPQPKTKRSHANKHPAKPNPRRRPAVVTEPKPNGFMAQWSPYSAETGREIVYRIAMGDALTDICSEPDKPSRKTVYHWIAQDPAFSDSMARAREASAHRLVEEAREIADDPTITESHEQVGAARLRIDVRKWMASKYKPQAYGDKLDVTADLQLTVNIKRFTPSVEAIDVQPIDITDDTDKP